jgi:hypothetical protein
VLSFAYKHVRMNGIHALGYMQTHTHTLLTHLLCICAFFFFTHFFIYSGTGTSTYSSGLKWGSKSNCLDAGTEQPQISMHECPIPCVRPAEHLEAAEAARNSLRIVFSIDELKGALIDIHQQHTHQKPCGLAIHALGS